MLSQPLELKIIKPVNSSWNEFKRLLKELRYNYCRMCNRVIQLCYMHENQRRTYREVSGCYPRDIIMYGVRFNDWVYLKVLDEFAEVPKVIILQAVQHALHRWQTDKCDVYSLRKSIPSFDISTPISLHSKSYTLAHAEDAWTISADLGTFGEEGQYQYTWVIQPRDTSSAEVLECLAVGQYRKDTLQFQQDSQGKWYCIIAYNVEPMMGVDLGTATAV